MAFAVRLTCDHGQESGEPCPAYVAVAVDESWGGSVLVSDADDPGRRMFTVETEWIDVPEGWQLTSEAKLCCPEHASAP